MKKYIYPMSIIVLGFLLASIVLAAEPRKVLILPFEIHAQQDLSYLKRAIPEMLTSRLFSPGKIQAIDPEKVDREIKNYVHFDKKTAEELGKKVGADYVIWGSITVIGELVSIDAQIMDLTQTKKPAQFFQEIKGLSEVIPQLTRFARKAKKYIEGKEEDFYQEDLSLAYGGPGYIPGRAHPERGYFGYPVYPMRPPKEETPVERAKPRFGGVGDPAYEGLTKDIVIDLSGPQPRIGIAREKDNATSKLPQQPPPYLYYYPPQPYYNYSPPPYYYYQAPKEDDGILSRLKRAVWPFGREERKVAPPPVPVMPQPVPLNPQQITPQNPPIPQPQTMMPTPQQASPTKPPTATPHSPPKPTPEKEPVKNNPWRWE